MLLVIIIRLALCVLLNTQFLNRVSAVPASGSGEGSSGRSNREPTKKQLTIDDTKTISILKKNQPVAVQDKINKQIKKGLSEAERLNHQHTNQALNLVALTARQNHPDAWRHIFHTDSEVTKGIWDRTHLEMTSKKVRLPNKPDTKGKEKGQGSKQTNIPIADYGKSKSFNLRHNAPKSHSKPEKGRSRSV